MSHVRRARIREEVPKIECRYCLTKENLTFDHKIPKIQGGSDDTKNIQVLCFRCNGIKSGLSHKQVLLFAHWIYGINKKRAENNRKPLGVGKKYL